MSVEPRTFDVEPRHHLLRGSLFVPVKSAISGVATR